MQYQVDVDLVEDQDFTDSIHDKLTDATDRGLEIADHGVERQLGENLFIYGPNAIKRVIVKPHVKNTLNG